MKPTAEFDPHFVAMPGPKCRRIRLWRLSLLCAPVAALALVLANTNRAPGSPIIAQALVPGQPPLRSPMRQPGSGSPLRLIPVPGDRFVWMASPAIDPEIVHAAPDGIDEAMVLPARDSEPAR
jgi:hypothetical protein